MIVTINITRNAENVDDDDDGATINNIFFLGVMKIMVVMRTGYG